eukprot:7082279-Prymnesium_polylepis.1
MRRWSGTVERATAGALLELAAFVEKLEVGGVLRLHLADQLGRADLPRHLLPPRVRLLDPLAHAPNEPLANNYKLKRGKGDEQVRASQTWMKSAK